MNEHQEAKLDKALEHIASIDVTLAKQAIILDEHIKRTNLLEAEVKPIKKHVDMVEGAIKLIMLLGVVIGIAEAIVHIFW